MASEWDPERNELQHLRDAFPLQSKAVLEIGCGDGRLTGQYSSESGSVIGIDPDITDLKLAKGNGFDSQPGFIQAKAEELPFAAGSFDLVIFASSF
jgi:ubiquinone/menaquinone biosynthesis C-methylase UbiE